MASITDVAHLDTVLIVDGTYYVHEAGGEIRLRGWSRRNRLHAGAEEAAVDARLLDPRTGPGTPARGSVLSATSTVVPQRDVLERAAGCFEDARKRYKSASRMLSRYPLRRERGQRCRCAPILARPRG